jgi:hypothetical protein
MADAVEAAPGMNAPRYHFYPIEWRAGARNNFVRMFVSAQGQVRLEEMVRSTMRAIKTSRELLRQTERLLEESRLNCGQIRIKRPDNLMSEKFSD